MPRFPLCPMKLPRRGHALLLSLALALPAAAQAAPLNGSFEAGLSGWTVLGDAAAASSPAATDGSRLAWIGTASATLADDAPQPAGHANLSGQEPLPVGTAGGLEEGLGLAIGALDPDAAGFVFAIEGSALMQDFVTAAPGLLRFDWRVDSLDPLAGTASGDRAFVLLDGVLTVLGGPGSGSFSQLLGAGSHRLAFGVIDVLDALGSTRLGVDAVQVAAPVPEPSSWALMLAGLAAAGFTVQRRSRR